MSEEITRAIGKIAEDRRSGATELARQALGVLERVLEVTPRRQRQAVFDRAVRQLLAVRPSMSGLANVVIRASRVIGGEGSGVRGENTVDLHSTGGVETVQERIHSLGEELETGEQELARRASGALRGTRRLMTLSSSGSVLAVLRELADGPQAEGQGGLPEAFVAESRPRCEGVETARCLAEMGYQVSVIADAAVGHHAWECDAAVIGADTVLADGTIYNKMGSLPLALACRHWNVPLYVVTLAHKIRLTEDKPELEEMDAEELGTMPEGVRVRNVYFEAVPGELVTAIWSDLGTLTTETIEALRRRWLGTDEDKSVG